ncbi:hypothetical protein HII13_002506 [Brettanomyces bruxellensis]|nr:hypothetical protein HII13_002506 [Brettanomyces bruxellensis]
MASTLENLSIGATPGNGVASVQQQKNHQNQQNQQQQNQNQQPDFLSNTNWLNQLSGDLLDSFPLDNIESMGSSSSTLSERPADFNSPVFPLAASCYGAIAASPSIPESSRISEKLAPRTTSSFDFSPDANATGQTGDSYIPSSAAQPPFYQDLFSSLSDNSSADFDTVKTINPAMAVIRKSPVLKSQSVSKMIDPTLTMSTPPESYQPSFASIDSSFDVSPLTSFDPQPPSSAASSISSSPSIFYNSARSSITSASTSSANSGLGLRTPNFKSPTVQATAPISSSTATNSNRNPSVVAVKNRHGVHCINGKRVSDSRMSLVQLAIVLGLGENTAEASMREKQILSILKDELGFPLGRKTWIRDTPAEERDQLMDALLVRVEQKYHYGYDRDSLGVVVRRASYYLMQGRLRRERRINKKRNSISQSSIKRKKRKSVELAVAPASS